MYQQTSILAGLRITTFLVNIKLSSVTCLFWRWRY